MTRISDASSPVTDAFEIRAFGVPGPEAVFRTGPVNAGNLAQALDDLNAWAESLRRPPISPARRDLMLAAAHIMSNRLIADVAAQAAAA